MVNKFSNAQEFNIFSNSNVNFYTILSPVLDSDSEILTMNYTSSHHLFFKIFFRGGIPPNPPSVARLLTQSTAATKNQGETLSPLY